MHLVSFTSVASSPKHKSILAKGTAVSCGGEFRSLWYAGLCHSSLQFGPCSVREMVHDRLCDPNPHLEQDLPHIQAGVGAACGTTWG